MFDHILLHACITFCEFKNSRERNPNPLYSKVPKWKILMCSANAGFPMDFFPFQGFRLHDFMNPDVRLLDSPTLEPQYGQLEIDSVF
jgi:hypothetical protein